MYSLYSMLLELELELELQYSSVRTVQQRFSTYDTRVILWHFDQKIVTLRL